MAADPNHVKEVSRSFVTSDGVFRVSECQSCFLLKKGFANFSKLVKIND